MALALVDKQLEKIVKDKLILRSFFDDLSEFIEPASIDLPVGEKIYHVTDSFLPVYRNILHITESKKIQELDLNEGALLIKGQTYVTPIGRVSLPGNMSAKVSPKSSIGRIDLFVRAITDMSGFYDFLPPLTEGNLWLEIKPQSFNVLLKKGTTLSQIRFKQEGEQKYRITPERFIDKSYGRKNLRMLENNQFPLSLKVSDEEITGYRAKATNKVIDLQLKNHYDPSDFFEKINVEDGRKIILEENKFYILSTKENISVPGNYSIEMLPFSHIIGELRAHYAGFFDPGFGLTKPLGASGVLEIRPNETLSLYDEQPIAMIEIIENVTMPKKLYGGETSHYQDQRGPRLAKYFKQEKL